MKHTTMVWKSHAADGDVQVDAKPLEGGDMAVGIFNLGAPAALPSSVPELTAKGRWKAQDR